MNLYAGYMSTLLIIVLIALVLLIPTAYAGLIGAPYAPTRRAAIKKAYDLMEVGEEDLVVDLGAGDGVALRLAAARDARVLGYELSPIFAPIAWLTTRRWGSRARIKMQNFYRATLPKDTSVVFVFLLPDNMKRLRDFITKQPLSSDTRVLAYTFALPDVQPETVVQEKNCGAIYIYRFGELAGRE